MTITKRDANQTVSFLGFDGKTYDGQIVDVLRRRWLVFTYQVAGLGEVRNVLDMKAHKARIAMKGGR